MSDREQHGLRGPVFMVRTEHFNCDQQTGEMGDQPRFANVFVYDRAGRTTSSTHENPGGSVSTTNHTYNDRGDVARTTYDWAGKPGGDTIYHYDGAGRLIRVIQLAPDGSERERSRLHYDPDGGKTEVRFGVSKAEMEEIHAVAMRSSGNVGSDVGFDLPPATTTIRYDDAGRPLEELEHDENHVLTRKTIHTYDERGLLVETRRESGHKLPFSLPPPDDPSMGPIEREALEKTFARLFQPGASIHRTTYAYDGHGRKVEEISHFEPFGSDKSTTEYNEHGDPIVVRSVHESREFQATLEGELVNPKEAKQTTSVNLFQYTYDKHGNWTEKIYSFVDPSTGESKRITIERRTITYW
jgi:hypothetical protein